ncbi:hypothetical protein AAHC03_05806 [Spirometra sp. Aus1]
MHEAGNVCTKCRKPPVNPHAMVCGHVFCLNPCLLPANSNQPFVQCPLCCIETEVVDLEPVPNVHSSDASIPLTDLETKNNGANSEPCQQNSTTASPECVSKSESEVDRPAVSDELGQSEEISGLQPVAKDPP